MVKNIKRKTKKSNKTGKTNKTIKNIYTKQHFHSNDGMLTSVWGPGMWHYLHTMSFNYPINPTLKDKHHYRDFVLQLKYVLPCGKCRKNLVKNFKKLPLKISHMKDRDTFSRYIYDLHEIVNKMLGKKSNLTYEMVRERYEHFRARCAKPKINKKTRKNKKCKINSDEIGCTEPLVGKKAKCILKIVPQEQKSDTFQINKQCIKRKKY